MKFTFDDLKKMKHLKTKEDVFVFDDTTPDYEFVNLSGNETLKEIRFTAPQNKLRYLDASRCKIEKITFPQECENLQALYLHHNNLQEVEFATGLPNLKLLDLSFNKNLVELNADNTLPALKYLYLHQCNIKSLQQFAKQFTGVGFDFNIDKNENLESPPVEIVKKGKAAVLNYYAQIKREKGKTEYLFETKLLIIGEGGTGKTSFTLKMKDENAELPKDEDTTLGIEVTKWSFDIDHLKRGKQKMYANLWDFGGQKLYQGTHQIFFSQKSFYVLLDDTREEKTNFAFWLNTVEQLAGNESKLLIVTNKKHKHIPQIDENGLKGRFGNLITGFFTVDLKKDIPKIVELQNELKHLIPKLPGIGEPLPASWVAIRKDLFNENENCISYDRYLQICRKNKTDLKQLDFLSDYFNRVGVFTHYYDDTLLKNRVFLNSNWLVNTVYEVLNHKLVKENDGRISEGQLKEIWSKSELFNQIDYLSRLMHRFGLMYEVAELKTYVVPAHLPAEQPYPAWLYENKPEILQFAYEFDKYMPRGIMPRIIVALHRYIKNQKMVWNRGVNIELEGTYAEIKETYDRTNKFLIRITGNQKKELLGIIIHEFEKILGPYKKLHFEKLVPCICSVCKKIPNPFFFKHSELIDRKEAGKKTIECGKKPFEQVNVDKLLDGVTPPKESIRQEKNENIHQTIYKTEHIIKVTGNGIVIGQDLTDSNSVLNKHSESLKKEGKTKTSKKRFGIVIILAIVFAVATVVIYQFYPDIWKILAPIGLIMIGFVAFWNSILDVFKKSKEI